MNKTIKQKRKNRIGQHVTHLRVVVDNAAAHVPVHDKMLLCNVVARLCARGALVEVVEVDKEARGVLELLHRRVCADVHVLVDVAHNKVARVFGEHACVQARVQAVHLAVQHVLAESVHGVDEVGLHTLALHSQAVVRHGRHTREVLAFDRRQCVEIVPQARECRVGHVRMQEDAVGVASGHAKGREERKALRAVVHALQLFLLVLALLKHLLLCQLDALGIVLGTHRRLHYADVAARVERAVAR